MKFCGFILIEILEKPHLINISKITTSNIERKKGNKIPNHGNFNPITKNKESSHQGIINSHHNNKFATFSFE